MSEMRYTEAYEAIAQRGRDGIVLHGGVDMNFYDVLDEIRHEALLPTPDLPAFNPLVVLEWEGDTAYITELDEQGYRVQEIERVVLEPEGSSE
jgi:hypothetical protein